jgi:putative membrane protein
MVGQSLAGLPAFLAYFCLSVVVVVGYLAIYTQLTPYDEFDSINHDKPGVAIALGLSLIGFALPVASAIAHSANLIDCLIWSLIALAVQVLVFFIAGIPVPDLSHRVAKGEMAAAIWLGLASVAAGILSAASMSL